MSLSYREIEYYVSFVSNKLYNNIILKEWNNLLEDYSKIYKCNFIYCSFIDSSDFLLLFKTHEKDYCVVKNKNVIREENELENEFKKIQNELNQVEEQQSVVELTCYSNIVDAIDIGFSKKERKSMNICSTKSMKLSHEMKENLASTNFVDFICLEEKNYIDKLQNYINGCQDSLNLALFTNLKCDYFNGVDLNEKIKSINLNSNNSIDSLTWIQKFPKVENLTISFCSNINDDSVKEICSNSIKSIDFYNCETITLLSLKSILENTSIESVSFINPNMNCGKPLCPLISQEDWNNLYEHSGSKTIKNLYIDSVYLSKDTCHDIINSCRNLQRLVLNTENYNQIINDVHDGYNKEDTIVICNHEYSEKRVFRKTVSISRLKRDSIEPAFSNSMLKIIQQNKNKK